MNIGLSNEQVQALLDQHDVNEETKQAIVAVIEANNKAIENQIQELLSGDFAKAIMGQFGLDI